MITFELLVLLYVVPLVVSSSIFGYFVYRDLKSEYMLTIGEVVGGILLCVLPILNWLIILSVVLDAMRCGAHRVKLWLGKPISKKCRGRHIC